MTSDLRLLFLDFETYYDEQYSLSKMPTPNYILDDRFETILVAVREGKAPGKIIDGPDFPAYLSTFDPQKTITVAFNAAFDNSILAWRYGFVPKRMLDPMGMARALRGHILESASLAAVLRHLGMRPKGNALIKVKGLRREQIIGQGLWPEFCAYALWDVGGCAEIFETLLPEFPEPEQRVMDLVLRCTVEPGFRIDVPLLEQHLRDLADEKDELLRKAGITDKADLMSQAKFAELLTGLGVQLELKQSPTGNMIPAFAKSDQFMEDLLEDECPRVAALAAARLGHKSTIEETRCAKFLSVASLPWARYRGGNTGTMPMPLAYGRAHTHRLAGDWGMNVQNMPTKRGSKGKSRLRNSVIPPPGCSVVTADLKQIEARLVAWLCGAKALLAQFAANGDPYAALAESIFGYPVDRKKQIVEGFIGKTGILGLGYTCGADHFYEMVIVMARAASIVLPAGLWTRELAKKSVDAYRRDHREIPRGWRDLDRILELVWGDPTVAPQKFGPVTIESGRVNLPNGLAMNYGEPSRMFDAAGRVQYGYKYGKYRHKLFGGKLLENIVQALARIIVMNAALRLECRGYRFKLQAHDELVFIVPDNQVDIAKTIIYEEMRRRPSWGTDIPLDADIGVGKSYGEAK